MSNKDIEKKSILQKELSAKEVLLVVGIFAILFMYGFFAIAPKYTGYKLSKSNLESVEEQINTYQNRIYELPKLEDKLDSLNKEAKIKGKILEHNMENGMFLVGLSNFMEQTDVELIDYSMEQIIPYKDFYAIPTTIEVRGNYKNVREIMYYMEEQKNMTQILDYSMETYIEEKEEVVVETSGDVDNDTSKIIADSTVYWTKSGTAYHKEDCTVLESQAHDHDENILSGSSSQSEKYAACDICKPYKIETTTAESNIDNINPDEKNINGTTEDEIDERVEESPKAEGYVTAIFNFIMYSSQDPNLELDNDNPSEWNPGKWNPFKTTTR